MGATRFELADHFPGKGPSIEALLTTDSGFESLCLSYQAAVAAIRRRATDAVYTDPRMAEDLTRTRRRLAAAIADRLADLEVERRSAA